MLNGLIPLPNNGPVGYISAPSLPNDWRQENIRIDQNIGDGTRIFGRYTQESTQLPLHERQLRFGREPDGFPHQEPVSSTATTALVRIC